MRVDKQHLTKALRLSAHTSSVHSQSTIFNLYVKPRDLTMCTLYPKRDREVECKGLCILIISSHFINILSSFLDKTENLPLRRQRQGLILIGDTTSWPGCKLNIYISLRELYSLQIRIIVYLNYKYIYLLQEYAILFRFIYFPFCA